MTDLISRDKVHEFIAVALSEYLTDEEREILETLDVDVANIPTIQAVPIDVLDKIRAEIEKPLHDERCFDTADAKAQYIALNWCIEIIDKYRKEQE